MMPKTNRKKVWKNNMALTLFSQEWRSDSFQPAQI